MKVIGINGSPRKGNSFILLKEFLRGAEEAGFETLIIDACKLKISFCMECGFCSEKGVCRIEDAMSEVRDNLSECAHVAVASPVFFFGISAQLKTLIDRCQPFWALKYQLGQDIGKSFDFKRKGYFFSTGGFNKSITFRGGELTVKSFFDALSIEYSDNVCIGSMENKGDILKEQDAMKKAYLLGKILK